jgi:hypothetical protein
MATLTPIELVDPLGDMSGEIGEPTCDNGELDSLREVRLGAGQLRRGGAQTSTNAVTSHGELTQLEDASLVGIDEPLQSASLDGHQPLSIISSSAQLAHGAIGSSPSSPLVQDPRRVLEKGRDRIESQT